MAVEGRCILNPKIEANLRHLLMYSNTQMTFVKEGCIYGEKVNENCRSYTRLQTVWSLPGHSRQANKDHGPRCHRRPNGPGRLADKVVQPTTQSAEGCTYM